MNRDVFLSLLALDSYNRGYGQNVLINTEDSATGQNEIGRFIGSAQIIEQRINTEAQVAGFYAIAYEWEGETIISYRGTNFPKGLSFSEVKDFITKDFGGGWDIFTGIGTGSHARMARDFYVSVTGRDFVNSTTDPIATGVTLTGHSLGGGLAGYVASRTYAEANIFDPVPFGAEAYANAIGDAFRATLEEFNLSEADFVEWVELFGSELLSALIPGFETNGQDFADRLAENIEERAPYFGNVSGYHLEGEIAASIDVLQSAIGGALTSLPFPLNALGLQQLITATSASLSGDRSGVVEIDNRNIGDVSNSISLHTMSWMTMMLFGEKQWSAEGGGEGWKQSIRYILPNTSDDTIADFFGLDDSTGEASPGAQMASMIAYSLLEAGADSTLIFGDTAIRAMFDDADDLGRVVTRLPNVMAEEKLDELGSLIAEFAGLLAYNKIESAQFEDATAGIVRFGEGDNILRVDVSRETWSQYDTRDGSLNYQSPAAGFFVSDLLDQYIGGERSSGGEDEALHSAFENWLFSPGTTGVQQTPLTRASDLIDNVVFTFGGLPLGGVTDLGGADGSYDGFQLLIGEDTTATDANNTSGYSNTIINSPAIVVSGNGDNTFVGTAQSDAFITGSGTDQLVGGGGHDFFAAGAGTNTIWGDNSDRTGSGIDTVYIGGTVGTQQINYSNDSVVVASSNSQSTLYDVEEVIFESGQILLNIEERIASDTQLSIRGGDGGIQVLNMSKSGGVDVFLSETNAYVEDRDTGGRIGLYNFNTEIVASEFDDGIVDFSDQEKVIAAHDGDDFVSVEGTEAQAIIFGGNGTDAIVGSETDDYLIDHGSGSQTYRELDDAVWNGRTLTGYGSVVAGAGNDVVIIGSSADLDRRTGYKYGSFGAGFFINAGEGDDTVQLTSENGSYYYVFGRGDGADTIYDEARSLLSDGLGFSSLRSVVAPKIAFDLSDFSSGEVSATFNVTSYELAIDQGEIYATWELRGELVITMADGGLITIPDTRTNVDGTYDFNGNLWELDEIDLTRGSEVTKSQWQIATSDGGPIIMSFNIGGAAQTEAVGATESIQKLALSPLSMTSSIEAIGEDAEPIQNAVGPTGDQDAFLATGDQILTGGSGRDRLIVTWDLDTLTSTLSGNELIIEDIWGLIGSTSLVDFDEIYAVAEDTTYSPEEFHAELARRRQGEEISGSTEDDTLTGTDRRDRLFGLGGNDTLIGLDGDDLLDGGTGADVMEGGVGNDIYVVDSELDLVVEASGEGADRVESEVSYQLSENVEDLTLRGLAADGTGNDLNNRIIGTPGANILAGLGGNDFLDGGNRNDELHGGDGDDILIGGRGDDRMVGGSGNDTYSVDSEFDSVIEQFDEGRDSVIASIDFSLGANVENLSLTGDALIGTGNELSNSLVGNDRDNTLEGAAGDDYIEGRDGADLILGGTGDDRLIGGSGVDFVSGGDGDDIIYGDGDRSIASDSGQPSDPEFISEDFEVLDGGGGNDVMFAGSTSTIMYGGAGDDLLYGGAGSDVFIDDEGNDLYVGDGYAVLSQIGSSIGRVSDAAETEDVLVLQGPMSEYSVSALGNDWFEVSRLSEGGGTDHVVNMSALVFEFDGGSDILVLEAPAATGVDLSFDFLEDESISLAIAPDWFTDANGNDITYGIGAVSNGSWSIEGGQIVGQPVADFNGTLTLELIATSLTGSSSKFIDVAFAPVNDAPVAIAQLPDVYSSENTPFAFTVDPSSFTDVDGDILSLSATLAHGNDLPSWISFDGSSFSGTPPQEFSGSLELVVTASDGELSVTTGFTLTIDALNDPPILLQPLADQSSSEDTPFSFEIPDGTFADLNGDVLALTATLADGSGLPAWLNFDGAAFTGIPPQDFNGVLDLRVTASDGDLSVADDFRLTIDPVNDAPVVSQALLDQTALGDTLVQFSVSSGSFIDVDGDVLGYTATLADGSDLPTWLAFDATTLTFEGLTPNTDTTLGIRVTAADGELSVSEDFALTIDAQSTGGGSTEGFSFVSLNSWYDPAWGGGYNVTFNYEVQPEAIAEGELKAWEILASYTGPGTITGGWVSGFPGPATFEITPDGAVFSTNGQDYQPELAEGQTFQITVQVNGAPYTAGDFAFEIFDRDPALNLADDQDTSLAIAPTNDWGSGLSQSVSFTNLSDTTIDDWQIVLDVPDGVDFAITNVWDATATILANGDILFEAVSSNEEIAPGGQASFGFNASYSGIGSLTFSQSDFSFTDSDARQFDVVLGSLGTAGAGANWLYGTVDTDDLTGTNSVANRIFGAVGDDTLTGGTLGDWLAGGSGDDTLVGLHGDDTLWGGHGNDLLYGGLGFDTVQLLGLMDSYSVVTQGGAFGVRINDLSAIAHGDDGMDQLSSIEQLAFRGGETLNITSPIILDLAGDGIETVSAADSNALFDLDGDGLADDTSWIGSGDAFLYIDRDGNGTMSGVEEISFIDDVENAATDLDGLAAFDSNGDGVLNSDDVRFAEFGVWRDADGDGAVDAGETASLSQVGIASVDLTGTPADSVVEFGEVAIANTGTYTLTNGAMLEFADAALTYFSAADNVPQLTATHYDFDRKSKKYRLSVAGGAVTVVPKKSRRGMDPLAGQLGANTILTFSNRTYGMFAPVALDLDGDGLELVKREKSRAVFDYNGDGASDDTGWLKGDDGFLVIDRNDDGLITEASELTLASEDEEARSGLQGLARLDSNGDGRVDTDDARFGELRVWQDRNGDGRTDAGELRTLEEVGIVSLRLDAVTANQDRVKLGRNALVATTSFVRSNGTTGTAADISLAYRPATAPATSSAFETGIFGFSSDIIFPRGAFRIAARDEISLEDIFDRLRTNNMDAMAELFDRIDAEGGRHPDCLNCSVTVPVAEETQPERPRSWFDPASAYFTMFWPVQTATVFDRAFSDTVLDLLPNGALEGPFDPLAETLGPAPQPMHVMPELDVSLGDQTDQSEASQWGETGEGSNRPSEPTNPPRLAVEGQENRGRASRVGLPEWTGADGTLEPFGIPVAMRPNAVNDTGQSEAPPQGSADGNAELARKLMMIRQDMSSFGVKGAGEEERLHHDNQEYLQFYA